MINLERIPFIRGIEFKYTCWAKLRGKIDLIQPRTPSEEYLKTCQEECAECPASRQSYCTGLNEFGTAYIDTYSEEEKSLPKLRKLKATCVTKNWIVVKK